MYLHMLIYVYTNAHTVALDNQNTPLKRPMNKRVI